MGTTTVQSLLGHFRDDPTLQPLFQQLDELSKRVEAANAQNTLDLRSRPLHHSASVSSPSRAGGASRWTRSGHAAPQAGGRPHSTGHLVGATAKIEDASLPIPPLEPSSPLAGPPGGHDWEALQEPVNVACAQFSSPAAKATWKQWALTAHNVDMVVAVAWWVVAQVFRPEHPLAPAVKEHVFRFFARHYSLDVLKYGGAGKDLYHNLWQSVVASACVNLLRSAYPRSAHKVDGHLEEFVRAQLVRWTAGILPLDLHPSNHELVGLGTPAAHTHYQRHAQQAGMPSTTTTTTTATTSAPLLSGRAGAGGTASLEAQHLASVVSGAVGSPTAQLYAGGALAASDSAEVPQDKGGSGNAMDAATSAAGAAQPPGSEQQALLASGFDVQQASPAVSYLFQAHTLSPLRKHDAALPGVMAHTFGMGQRSRRRPVDGALALPAHRHIPERQLDGSRASGGRSAGDAQEANSDGAVEEDVREQLGQPGAQQGNEEFSYGALAKKSCVRAAAAVKRYEQYKASSRREVACLSKGWLASRDALQARVSELTITSAAKVWPAALRRLEDMSDRLSNWIENDVDRMMRDQPVATKHFHQQRSMGLTAGCASTDDTVADSIAHSASPGRRFGAALSATEAVLKAGGGASAGATAMSGASASMSAAGAHPPGYLAMTAATVAGAGCASASFLAATAAGSGGGSGPSLTRIMQPWSKMRSVEAKIRGTLSQVRAGSNDMAAHLHTLAKDQEARDRTPGMRGNGLRGREWRPAPVEYTRGTLDIRLRHQVLKALRAAEV